MNIPAFYRFPSPGERAAAENLIKLILHRGFAVSVWDGEDMVVRRSRDLREILEGLATTEDDILCLFPPLKSDPSRSATKSVGNIRLIWGNSGEDLMADWHVTLDKYFPEFETSDLAPYGWKEPA